MLLYLYIKEEGDDDMSSATATNVFIGSKEAKELNIKNRKDARNVLIKIGVMNKNGKMKKHICNGGYYDKRD